MFLWDGFQPGGWTNENVRSGAVGARTSGLERPSWSQSKEEIDSEQEGVSQDWADEVEAEEEDSGASRTGAEEGSKRMVDGNISIISALGDFSC